MTPHYSDDAVTLFHGDCVEVMDAMEPDSVDAVVCDPPYELGFMGKAWDASGVAYRSETWAAVLRVLKPGGHLLAFGGTRTYHRMTVAVEDAGFEIRDCIAWMYGSGFPKSLDVSKAIDKAEGAEREVLETKTRAGMSTFGASAQGYRWGDTHYVWDDLPAKARDYYAQTGVTQITAPATPDAVQWDGWGTALKPAHEPIVVARKPFGGTVAGNVLEWGTGALNIDGCRIDTQGETWGGNEANAHSDYSGKVFGDYGKRYAKPSNPSGRWPANVVLDPEAATILDQQSGVTKDGTAVRRNVGKSGGNFPFGAANPDMREDVTFGGEGGASRFFYCAKASRADRGTGNNHPTVKPVELMRWLVRLVTPPGGTVLDPFAGSGTTLIAAVIEGFRSIGIETEPDHLDIIRHRLTQPIAPVLDLDGGAA